MNILWDVGKAYLKDIVSRYPNPKPAYTTVSTVVNVLVKKGFVDFVTHGKAHEYAPKVDKSSYTRFAFKGMLSSFFNNSTSQFASFFTTEQNLKVEELQELKKLIDQEINKQQAGS